MDYHRLQLQDFAAANDASQAIAASRVPTMSHSINRKAVRYGEACSTGMMPVWHPHRSSTVHNARSIYKASKALSYSHATGSASSYMFHDQLNLLHDQFHLFHDQFYDQFHLFYDKLDLSHGKLRLFHDQNSHQQHQLILPITFSQPWKYIFPVKFCLQQFGTNLSGFRLVAKVAKNMPHVDRCRPLSKLTIIVNVWMWSNDPAYALLQCMLRFWTPRVPSTSIHTSV